MRWLLIIALSASAWAQITTVTVREALWPNTPAKDAISETVVNPAVGLTRSNFPATFGVPLSDSQAISSPSTQLFVAGATLQQFSCSDYWPSGNCKWALIDTPVSLTGSSTTTLTITIGSGNTAGTLATDNTDCAGAHSGYIKIDTGTSCFALRKASFNLFDQVVTNGVTLVSANTSDGFVLQGPAANGSTTTCASPLSGCTTVYKSSNDAGSSCSIAVNGPARATIFCSGGLVNGSEAYMNFAVWMTFYKNQNYVKLQSQLRNALESSGAGNFASATKGFRSLEMSIALNLSGSKTATFPKDNTTGGTSTYTFVGSESAYSWQGFSTNFENDSWANSLVTSTSYIERTGSYPYTYSLDGFQINANGSTQYAANRSHIQDGWADIVDGSGRGLTIGGYQFSAFWPKMLGYFSGGSVAKIGIWPDQGQWISPVGNILPYWQLWPQYATDTVYLNFHDSAVTNPGNEILKQQNFLVANAPYTYYNSTGVFPYKLGGGTATDNYLIALGASANPTKSYTGQSDFAPSYFHYYGWGGVGGDNQMDFPLSYLMDFLNRGWTGRMLWGFNKTKFIMEVGEPRADFLGGWIGHIPQSDLDYAGRPTGVTSANRANGMVGGYTNIWADIDHGHIYGTPTWYYLFGDLAIKDFVDTAMRDRYANHSSSACSHYPNPGTTSAANCWNAQRGLGVEMMAQSHLYEYASGTSQTTLAGNTKTAAENVISFISPDIVMSGTGSSPNNSPYGSFTQFGTSRSRGYFMAGAVGTYTTPPSSCNLNTYPTSRLAEPFENDMVVQGLDELQKSLGTSWTLYNTAHDLAYGIIQWAMHEGFVTGRATSYDNGFVYSVGADIVCSGAGQVSPYCECGQLDSAWLGQQTVWHHPGVWLQYTGDRTKQYTLVQNVQSLAEKFTGGNSWSEFAGYTVADAIYWYQNPPTSTLQTVTITSFNESPAGTYTLGWAPLAGSSAQYLKYDANGKTIVEWLNFDINSGTQASGNGGTFSVNPSSNAPWFSSTYAACTTTCSTSLAAGASSVTVSGLPSGLLQAAFMLKAMAPTSSIGGSATSGKTVLSGKTVMQ